MWSNSGCFVAIDVLGGMPNVDFMFLKARDGRYCSCFRIFLLIVPVSSKFEVRTFSGEIDVDSADSPFIIKVAVYLGTL